MFGDVSAIVVVFVAFRSHWRFAAEFCTPGEGHEKGGVEGEVGYFRRNHLVPVPAVADLEALNALLLAGCRADEARILNGRREAVGVAMAAERDHLLRPAVEGFELAEVTFRLVGKQGCVTVKTNAYSVPAKPGTRVEARVYPLQVELWHGGRRIACHERCHGRRQQVLDLEPPVAVTPTAASCLIELCRTPGRMSAAWSGIPPSRA